MANLPSISLDSQMFTTYNNSLILDQFRAAISSGKLHHANLISSGPGEDGLPIGILLSKMLLCESLSACGSCGSCHRVERLEHPDLNMTFPIVSGSANGTSDDFIAAFREALINNPFLDPDSWQRAIATKNQQLQIPVKEIQNLQHKLSLTAAEGNNRVLLLWMPEQIKTAASNKLLKLIEEPLDNTYIILVSHRKKRLLPTILSRCAPWHCKPLLDKNFNHHFEKHDGATRIILNMVFFPNLGAAISASHSSQLSDTEVFATWMRTCYKGSPVEISSLVNDLSSMTKEELKTLVFRAQHFLERGFYHNVQATETSATDLGTINVQKLSSAVVPRGNKALSEALGECLKDLERNIHVKTSLTHTSYALHRAFRGI